MPARPLGRLAGHSILVISLDLPLGLSVSLPSCCYDFTLRGKNSMDIGTSYLTYSLQITQHNAVCVY